MIGPEMHADAPVRPVTPSAARRAGGSRLDADVVRLLERNGIVPEPLGAHRWRFQLANGRAVGVAARLDGEWLVTEPAQRTNGSVAPWALLRANSRLAEGVRYVRPRGAATPSLVGELFLGDEVDPTTRLASMCRVWKHAVSARGGRGGKTLPPRAAGEPEARKAEGWDRCLDEAGWSARERADGRRLIDLDVARGRFRAELEDGADRGPLFAVELLSVRTTGSAVREAMAELLLVGCGAVRLVRPVWSVATGQAPEATGTAPPRETVRLEADIGDHATTSEVDRALTALSVACRLLGREVALLADEELASRYLQMRAGALDDEGTPASPNQEGENE